MRTAKTQAEFDKIKKAISGKEKKLGINKFYEVLPFDPRRGFEEALAKHEEDQRKKNPNGFESARWGQWMEKTYMEKGYKHQVENFVKGFLTYYETWDGGTGEDHTVFFEWKKFKTGFNLIVHLKPWHKNPFEGKPNVMIPTKFAGVDGSQIVPLKRDPIPTPPKAGVDPPPLPPVPPPSKS